jgi:hypothetical protein
MDVDDLIFGASTRAPAKDKKHDRAAPGTRRGANQ